MTLTLTRIFDRSDGIFSELTDEKGKIIARTLEHAYMFVNDVSKERYEPKLYDGTFTCKRSMHRLHGMKNDFETFEITGVKDHTNILFHWGNWHTDSDGCVLLGEGIASSSKGQMITASKQAFAEFMELLTGVNEFSLVVQS